MRVRRLLLICLFLTFTLGARASETPAEHAASVYAQQELDAAPRHANIPDYSLSPDELAKSRQLSTIRVTLHFVEEAWNILSLLILLGLGVFAWMQKVAVKRFPGSRWAQGFLFLLLYLLVDFLVSLPLDVYQQRLSLQYGLSVQSWPSWLGDTSKSLGLTWFFGGLIMMLLFYIIRKYPRRWWVVFWGFTIPLVFLIMFAVPYINHLFNHYEPLQQSNPELVTRLEQVVKKGHMDIPPERMYLMKASEKVTTLNADVEGFGSSKRVVVWDTTTRKMTPDEILFVFGHESGHYVLGHIETGLAATIMGLFLSFFFAYYFVQWAIGTFGPRWGISSQNDWAALAVLLLVFSIFGVISEPIENSFSRMDEHAADVYGQEAVHGLVADPQAVAKGAFDVLGKISYADPNPSPLYEFWTYSHPAIGRRAAFATAYDPWALGMEPKYFKKQ
ncbi:M48 family metallopeptidase [Granulicella paludicola]|uniref:M48 family metallopeptidase n=1 Tax=Granulicella paludicola TaxID=474951 RepID=UPI0021E09DA1|nr:M48 family metallopeptidase [Granulicella paludicola]